MSDGFSLETTVTLNICSEHIMHLDVPAKVRIFTNDTVLEENYKGNRNDSLAPIQNIVCTTVLLVSAWGPLTSPNTMHKYFLAFTWVATPRLL